MSQSTVTSSSAVPPYLQNLRPGQILNMATIEKLQRLPPARVVNSDPLKTKIKVAPTKQAMGEVRQGIMIFRGQENIVKQPDRTTKKPFVAKKVIFNNKSHTPKPQPLV